MTDALIEQFDCVFARLWILAPDQQALHLMASSGLYTHVDGSFAHVPMGAYKVGKIAQNRMPFLSNQLADEPWVKDREWAIANQIQGFAGYPLVAGERVIGVLAAFSDRPMPPEFLEVLQVLCMNATVALDAAMQVQRQTHTPASSVSLSSGLPLSDQLAQILRSTRFILMGTEHPLPLTCNHILLNAAEQLQQCHCQYCRLRYTEATVTLEAIVSLADTQGDCPPLTDPSRFGQLQTLTQWLGGTLKIKSVGDRDAVQFWLELPITPLAATNGSPLAHQLSEREREVMTWLARGLRDRDIAQTLFISESTVKFHINNSLTKLNAKNRYQGVYQATIQGFI